LQKLDLKKFLKSIDLKKIDF